MEKFIYSELSYKIIGACMEVHTILGRGHKETIYGDALENEMDLRKIDYAREIRYPM